ncbi:hypothetical protein BGZ99_010285, partial [Dissophora globulifera]
MHQDTRPPALLWPTDILRPSPDDLQGCFPAPSRPPRRSSYTSLYPLPSSSRPSSSATAYLNTSSAPIESHRRNSEDIHRQGGHNHQHNHKHHRQYTPSQHQQQYSPQQYGKHSLHFHNQDEVVPYRQRHQHPKLEGIENIHQNIYDSNSSRATSPMMMSSSETCTSAPSTPSPKPETMSSLFTEITLSSNTGRSDCARTDVDHINPVLAPIPGSTVQGFMLTYDRLRCIPSVETMDTERTLLGSSSSSLLSSASSLSTVSAITDKVGSRSPLHQRRSVTESSDVTDYEEASGTLRHRMTPVKRLKSHAGCREKFPCKEKACTALFESRQCLSSHLTLCKQRPRKVCQCTQPGCADLFKSKESLARHQRKHEKGLVGIKYPCDWPGCGKFLATPKSLRDHKTIHMERVKGIRLTCSVRGCFKEFDTSRCQRAHELRCIQVMSGDRLKCPIDGCSMNFGSSDYVRRHVLDHEKGLVGIPFPCDFAYCEAVLANPLTLQRHQQLHEEQSLGVEWKCLEKNCGKEYSGSKQLTDHQSRMHKDLGKNHSFACPYSSCDSIFNSQKDAYKHSCYEK